MKKRMVILVILLLGGLSVWHFAFAAKTAPMQSFQLAPVTRGNLERTVSGTGTLDAVGTVEVGTQVSGTLAAVNVDFNDKVHKGQLLAVLDTSMLEASVHDAQATVNRTQAQYQQAQDDFKRGEPLHEKGFLSDQEFDGVKTSLESAKAAYASAQAALTRAQVNLKNAEIRSPIDGTVIQRNVEVGQTVAASLQAPTLFVIAQDLDHMEILGLVDESDIGQIRVGQAVRFTVQAYPDKTFDGRVSQIRLQPETVQNVVNYTVVIDADNPKRLLLPGMTATVNFVVEQVKDALLVPASALRIQPTQAMIDEMRKAWQGRSRNENGQPRNENGQPRFERGSGQRPERPSNMARLWYVDSTGAPHVTMVKTGATDGVTTAIESGKVEEGMQVIKGIAATDKQGAAQTSGPQRRGMFFRGFGG